jgi:hypothetical protein
MYGNSRSENKRRVKSGALSVLESIDFPSIPIGAASNQSGWVEIPAAR